MGTNPTDHYLVIEIPLIGNLIHSLAMSTSLVVVFTKEISQSGNDHQPRPKYTPKLKEDFRKTRIHRL